MAYAVGIGEPPMKSGAIIWHSLQQTLLRVKKCIDQYCAFIIVVTVRFIYRRVVTHH